MEGWDLNTFPLKCILEETELIKFDMGVSDCFSSPITFLSYLPSTIFDLSYD